MRVWTHLRDNSSRTRGSVALLIGLMLVACETTVNITPPTAEVDTVSEPEKIKQIAKAMSHVKISTQNEQNGTCTLWRFSGDCNYPDLCSAGPDRPCISENIEAVGPCACPDVP